MRKRYVAEDELDAPLIVAALSPGVLAVELHRLYDKGEVSRAVYVFTRDELEGVMREAFTRGLRAVRARGGAEVGNYIKEKLYADKEAKDEGHGGDTKLR